MKIWLDDERVPALGWVWLKRVHEVAAILEERADEVDYMSLDHDLGIHDPVLFRRYTFGEITEEEVEENGYLLVKWMIENDTWPAGDIYIHSDNAVAWPRMAEAIAHDGPYVQGLDKRTLRRV